MVRKLVRCLRRVSLLAAFLLACFVLLGLFSTPDKIAELQSSMVIQSVVRVEPLQRNYSKESNVDKTNTTDRDARQRSQLNRWNNLPIGQPDEFSETFILKRDNLTLEEQAEWDAGHKYAGYNVFVSDRIPLRRRVPDYRAEVCLNISYSEDLPQASVVIVFHKEALSALMRTVYNVFDRAPPRLLKEVILVDDFSESEQLMEPLETYIAKFPKVKVLRNTQREGLMRTRMRGVYAATAPVVIIKDAHTEYSEGWLEPLLDAVAKDRTTVAMSQVHVMSKDDFSFSGPIKRTSWGIHVFDFVLAQRLAYYDQKLAKARTSDADPIVSPAMLGTEFAVDKEFFLHLGGHDPGMEIWGAEEMELPFKTWMCGGSVKTIPCSRVFHLFRSAIHRGTPEQKHTRLRNTLRVAQVWMDEYRHFVYQRFGPKMISLVDIGNLTDQINLRKSLKCKSFDWYLRNVAYMVYVPRNLKAQGEIHNVGLPSWCLWSAHWPVRGQQLIKVQVCSIALDGHHQFWMITGTGQIRKDGGCMTYNSREDTLSYLKCTIHTDENQLWKMTTSKNIVHVSSGRCLGLNQPGQEEVIVKECIQGKELQQWTVVPRPGAPVVT